MPDLAKNPVKVCCSLLLWLFKSFPNGFKVVRSVLVWVLRSACCLFFLRVSRFVCGIRPSITRATSSSGATTFPELNKGVEWLEWLEKKWRKKPFARMCLILWFCVLWTCLRIVFGTDCNMSDFLRSSDRWGFPPGGVVLASQAYEDQGRSVPNKNCMECIWGSSKTKQKVKSLDRKYQDDSKAFQKLERSASGLAGLPKTFQSMRKPNWSCWSTKEALPFCRFPS